jgi:Ca2+-binding RTX toxin-like protein
MRRPALPLTAALVLAAGLVVAGPAPSEAAAPTCHGKKATIVGTEHQDHLVGTGGRDVIVGLGGDDTIEGRGGRDWICGGDGDDTLLGGKGDDRLYGQVNHKSGIDGIRSYHGDTLEGGPGDDLLDQGTEDRAEHQGYTDIGHETFSWFHSKKPVHVDLIRGIATGEGRDTLVLTRAALEPHSEVSVWVVGSNHDDRIVGSSRGEGIFPEGGDDLVHARGGGDAINEIYSPVADPGAPTGDDDLYGDGGNDLIFLRDGTDEGHGGPGKDDLDSAGAGELHGGAGDDRLHTDGEVVLKGDAGDDHLQANDWRATTTIEGGGGRDQVVLFTPAGAQVDADLAQQQASVDAATAPVTDVEHWEVIASTGQQVSVEGSDGADHVRVGTYGALPSPHATFTVMLGGGSDKLDAFSFASLTLGAGGGDDHVSLSGTGDIAADLGAGGDTVTTDRGAAPVPDQPAVRSYDGGAGTDTAHLDLSVPGDTCTSIEKGNCPD